VARRRRCREDESRRRAQGDGRAAVFVGFGHQGVCEGCDHRAGGKCQRYRNGLRVRPGQWPRSHHDRDDEQGRTRQPQSEDAAGRPALAAHGRRTYQCFREVGDEDRCQERQAAGTFSQRDSEGNVLRHTIQGDRSQKRQPGRSTR
jgi:hypothetical protein